MRVGLFVGDIQPTDGGGFTLVSEMLKEFGRLESASQHQFVLFHQASAELAKLAGNMRTVDLADEKPAVLSGRERFFQHFPGRIERTWNSLFRVSPSLPWDARVYRKHGVEFLLRLVPWHSMTMDLPFGALMWDLQHRVNPWFPEVCQLGEWEGREANYSRLCQRASLLFTGTSRGLEEIETYYRVPREHIKVVPLPTPRFALDAQGAARDSGLLSKFDLPKDFLFYPAQFWPCKNHVTVLEACRLVRSRTGWDLGVVFAGSEKGNRDFVDRHAAAIGLQESTRFLGYVSQQELVQLYKHAFCLAFSTFCGPDNLPPLEAFALDCPVIASSVPGAEEQLGDAALLFPPHDEERLAAHIIELRGNADLRLRLVQKGNDRARRQTWETYVKSLLAALDEFAKVRRAWGV